MTQLRRARTDDSLKEVIESLNRVIDALLGNTGGRIALIDDDGELLDTVGGASLGTNEPSLKVRSGIGEHALFQHSNGVDTILEVQDSGVTMQALVINQWSIEGAGDDLVFKEDGGAERVRFGDSASTYALLVTGDQRVTSSMVVNDWKASVSGDDLVWTDDANAEMVRFGDSSSTYHMKVTGPANVTGRLLVEGDFEVTGGPITPDALVGTPAAHGLYQDNVPKAWGNVSGSTTTINGSFNVDSVGDLGGSGHRIIVQRAFANSNWAPIVTPLYTPGGTAATTVTVMVAIEDTDSCIIYCHRVSDGAHLDPTGYAFAFFGAQ